MVVEVQGLVDEQLDVYVVHGLLQGGDYLQDVVVEEGVQQLQLLAN